jgi:hypothetical protein
MSSVTANSPNWPVFDGNFLRRVFHESLIPAAFSTVDRGILLEIKRVTEHKQTETATPRKSTCKRPSLRSMRIRMSAPRGLHCTARDRCKTLKLSSLAKTVLHLGESF